MDTGDRSDEIEALRKENAILRETLDAIDGTVVVYDAGRRFVLANRAYHSFFPHLPADSELAGMLYEDVLALSMKAGRIVDQQAQSDPKAYIANRIHAIDEHDAPPREMRDPRSGKWFMIRVRRTPTDNRVALRVEITEQKQMQEDLCQAREAAEQASRAKSQFLGIVSHELRTPLNAVINFARLIKEQIHGPLGAPEYAEYAGTILQSGTDLLSLIEDVLDFSRADTGQMTLNEQPLNLRGTILSVVRKVAERATQAGVVLDVVVPSDLPSVQGDRARLWQVFSTLVDRAIGQTPRDGTVRVSVTQRQDGDVEITITDGSPAITADEITRLTRPFAEPSGPDDGRTGIGLGLPLAQQIVRLHGGVLLFERGPISGTIAIVRLPAARNLAGTA